MQGEAKNLSNVGIKGRFKQVLILFIAILVGVIISFATETPDFHKAKKRHIRAKNKSQISLDKKGSGHEKERKTQDHFVCFLAWQTKT